MYFGRRDSVADLQVSGMKGFGTRFQVCGIKEFQARLKRLEEGFSRDDKLDERDNETFKHKKYRQKLHEVQLLALDVV